MKDFPYAHFSRVSFKLCKNIKFYFSFYLETGQECMELGDRSLCSAEQDPIGQSSITRDSTVAEEQGQKEQSTVTGDPALGEKQDEIEQSTVNGDPALGEEQGK